MSHQGQHIEQDELVSRLRAKDKSALNYLYDHYSGALYGTILRIVSNDEVAEEVLQDAFIKIWNNIESYDTSKGRLFTWMMQICRNLSIDKLRSREIKKEMKSDNIEANVYTIEREHRAYQSIDKIGVKELLNKLREDERLIVDLVYFRGYTHSEVSDEYDIPLGTVKTRLRMGLKNLRNLIGIKQ